MNLRRLHQSSLKALCCSIIMLITVDAQAAFIIQTTGPTEGGISVTIAAEGYAYFGFEAPIPQKWSQAQYWK